VVNFTFSYVVFIVVIPLLFLLIYVGYEDVL